MVRFVVDEVVPAELPLKTRPARAVLGSLGATGLPLLAASEVGELVVCPSENPLFWAIHMAYSKHRPLVLTPDAFWLTIAQGIEQHITLNAERLRPQLVAHEGKRRLEVEIDKLTLEEEDWVCCVEALCEQIEQHTAPDHVRLMACDFSTSGPVERIAGKSVLMSALRHFYSYYVVMACGIPEVELRGTVADWEMIRARIEELERYGLSLWASRLRPICDALVQTARGEPDRLFWQRIYLPHEIYGAQLVVGWCADLFPYLRAGGDETNANIPNRALEVSLEERIALCEAWLGPNGEPPFRESFEYGVSSDTIPCAGSAAPVTLRFDGHERGTTLIGGVLGVRQHGLWLEPAACWMVREQSATARAATALAAQFSLTPSGSPCSRSHAYHAELLEAFSHLGAGELYGGRWTLIDPAEWRFAELHNFYHDATLFGRLADGRDLFMIDVTSSSTRGVKYLYLVGHVEDAERDNLLSSFIVVATSFEDLVQRLRATDGAFFMDAPGFVPPEW